MRRLVRDRALATWRVPGAEHQVRPVKDDAEHRDLLRAKLTEECREVLAASTPANLREELGDVLAVLQGIAANSDIPWESVIREGEEKTLRSGPFLDGLVWDTGEEAASLDQNTPLSFSRLAEIRDLSVDSCSADAPYNPDVWALEKARTDLLAEVDRLTKHIAAYDHMNKVVDGDWQDEVDRHKTDKAMLRAHLADVTAKRDKAVRAAQHMAQAMAKIGPVIEKAMRLAAAGDSAGAAAVLADVASEESSQPVPDGGETP